MNQQESLKNVLEAGLKTGEESRLYDRLCVI